MGWFSCGAASLAAVVLARPECDVIAYCETGSEHPDNERFLGDCERRFGFEVVRLRSEIFKDTWDVWTRRRYMGGIAGAPCTRALKVLPRLRWQRPDDVHVFGYTSEERARAHRLRSAWKGAVVECPLIAGERRHLDDLPSDVEPTPAIVPACDLLCQLADPEA